MCCRVNIRASLYDYTYDDEAEDYVYTYDDEYYSNNDGNGEESYFDKVGL